MNSLADFKVLLNKNNLKHKSFGWYVLVSGDRWTISHDQLYLNGDLVSKPQINEYLKAGPKLALRSSKKITPKQGYENDCTSPETDDE